MWGIILPTCSFACASIIRFHSRRRTEMQDVVCVKGSYRGDKHQDFFALFDGHGGRSCSFFLVFGTEKENQKSKKKED